MNGHGGAGRHILRRWRGDYVDAVFIAPSERIFYGDFGMPECERFWKYRGDELAVVGTRQVQTKRPYSHDVVISGKTVA